MTIEVNEDAFIKSLSKLEGFEHDPETGNNYVKFNMIEITKNECRFHYHGECVYVISPLLLKDQELVPITLTGIEGRMIVNLEFN